MGQHKYNPTAQAAKNGELPPREKPMSKKEWEAMVMAELQKRTGLNQIYNALGVKKVYDGDLNG